MLVEDVGGERKGTGSPSIPCPHCNKLFMRGYNMRVHIDRVHNKVIVLTFEKIRKGFRIRILIVLFFLGVAGSGSKLQKNFSFESRTAKPHKCSFLT